MREIHNEAKEHHRNPSGHSSKTEMAEILSSIPSAKPNAISKAALKWLYPPSSPLSIQQMTTQEIHWYITILQSTPSSNAAPGPEAHRKYETLTRNAISHLPRHLLNSNPTKFSQNHVTKFLRRIGAGEALPPAAQLCCVHEELNGQIIADLMGAFEMEIEDFIPHLVQLVGGLGNLDRETRRAVRVSEDIMAMRLTTRDFCAQYRRSPKEEWQGASTGCEACNLIKIGASTDALVALHAFMLARMPDAVVRGERRSVRLVWLEGWMSCYGSSVAEELKRKSKRMAAELVRLRDGDDIPIMYQPFKPAPPQKEQLGRGDVRLSERSPAIPDSWPCHPALRRTLSESSSRSSSSSSPSSLKRHPDVAIKPIPKAQTQRNNASKPNTTDSNHIRINIETIDGKVYTNDILLSEEPRCNHHHHKTSTAPASTTHKVTNTNTSPVEYTLPRTVYTPSRSKSARLQVPSEAKSYRERQSAIAISRTPPPPGVDMHTKPATRRL